MNIIEVKNLKKYFGSTHAVDGISFDVPEGEIFGFLGPNGAGKTTTIKCLMNFIQPTFGEINILGLDAQKNSSKLKQSIGYLPGNVRLYDSLTGLEHIRLLEGIRGHSQIVNKLISDLEFDDKIRAKNLSSGNRQKLGLILALMHEPKLLIMDEPTVGLDPLLQNKIYEILENLSQKGTTIFMSSHNLPEVERLCRRVGIIKKGQLIALEDIEKMHARGLHVATVIFKQKFEPQDFNNGDIRIKETITDGLILNIKGDINILMRKLSRYELRDLSITHANLEEIFLEFYESDSYKKSEVK